jgi:hypothetical protein
VRLRVAVFVAIVQAILFLAHAFVYETWSAFLGSPDPSGISRLQLSLAFLSVSFVAASLLAFRYSHFLVRLFYTLSAFWLGVLSFFVCCACACWLLYALVWLLGLHAKLRPVALVLFSLAILASVLAAANASWTRVRRITVALPNLPESWRGRLGALVSDTHLGPVRGRGLLRRIVAALARLRPDVVFLCGDLYDGTAADLNWLAEPLQKLAAPLGAYFVTGNHEEFTGREKYLQALERSGVRVLNNEKVDLDGLQVVGVHYRDAANPQRFRSILQQAALDRNRASILLAHAPHQLAIPEAAGISLQLSGHTHGGQLFPFTWLVARIYGLYVHGLNRFGPLAVYTSSGAGTWGPPMRLGRGASPEIVLIRFA